MSINDALVQIQDDQALLELMMAGLKGADEIYRPTPYWAYYEARLVEELKRSGLKNFRSRKDSWGGAFGSVEVLPPAFRVNLDAVRLLSNKYTRRIPGWRDFLGTVSNGVTKLIEKLPHGLAFDMSLLDVQLLTFEYVKAQALAAGARSPADIGTALAGNPGDVFMVDGKPYTMQFLKFYWRYAFAAQWVDFANAKVIVELGSGMGSQAEIFHKLYPDATILLFDLPPQLYVAERYLSTIFPGAVVPYRDAHQRKTLDALEPGKIYMFGNWQFPMVADIPVDLFWNARSLGETEPHVVANYLSFVTKNTRDVYLNQVLGGQTLQSSQGPGVVKRTLWADYERALANYGLLGRRPSLYPSSPKSVLREHNAYADEAVWRKRV